MEYQGDPNPTRTLDEALAELRAWSIDDFLTAYAQGIRDFSRINLLRPELAQVCSNNRWLDCSRHPDACTYNPLWLDYLCAGERDFSWDLHGHCLFDELDDLPDARDLKGAMLTGVNLSGSYLYPVDFTSADLSRADLRRAIFIDCVFQGADLSRADLRDARFYDCRLTDANLYMARLDRAVVAGGSASGANLARAKLYRGRFTGVDLRRADLSRIHAKLVNLVDCDIREINLTNVRLPLARVSGSRITSLQRDDLLNALRVSVDEQA